MVIEGIGVGSRIAGWLPRIWAAIRSRKVDVRFKTEKLPTELGGGSVEVMLRVQNFGGKPLAIQDVLVVQADSRCFYPNTQTINPDAPEWAYYPTSREVPHEKITRLIEVGEVLAPNRQLSLRVELQKDVGAGPWEWSAYMVRTENDGPYFLSAPFEVDWQRSSMAMAGIIKMTPKMIADRNARIEAERAEAMKRRKGRTETVPPPSSD